MSDEESATSLIHDKFESAGAADGRTFSEFASCLPFVDDYAIVDPREHKSVSDCWSDEYSRGKVQNVVGNSSDGNQARYQATVDHKRRLDPIELCEVS